MNQALATRESAGVIVESVIAKGDLGKLTPAERTEYYRAVCESVGLNPLTQPLAYIALNGKLTLYALKGATDQLRKIYKIAVTDMTEAERGDVYVVTVKVADGEGRTDMAKGAVTIGNLKGDALANAIMKAETKAKRRATLSICGLGMLDESELDTVSDAPRNRVRDGSDGNPKSSRQAKLSGDWDFVKSIAAVTTVDGLTAWREEHADIIATFNTTWRDQFDEIYNAKLEELKRAASPTLSDDDSAKLLNSMIGMMGRMEARAALKSWIEDDQVRKSIDTLTEADRDTLRDAYSSRREALPPV